MPKQIPKKGNVFFPDIANGIYFSFDPPASKTGSDDKTVKFLELFLSVDLIQKFRVDAYHLYLCLIDGSGMNNGL